MRKFIYLGALAALLAGTGVASAQMYQGGYSGNDGWSQSDDWNSGYERRDRRGRLNVYRQNRESNSGNYRGGYPPQECVLDEGGGRFRPCSNGPN